VNLRIAVLASLALSVALHANGGQADPTEAERVQAIALGRSCQAPIIHLPAGRRDFDVYIENSIARVALVTAAALMMRQPLDAPAVRQAMKPRYRIWLIRARDAQINYVVTQVRVRARDRDLLPVQVRTNRFFLGSVPSHGIVPALRNRQPEFTFSTLPNNDFDVVVESSAGSQRYPVTQRERQHVMRVCNEEPR